RLTEPDPLIGARDVAGVLAGREQLAEDLLRRDEIVDLAARDRRERLIEEHHALIGAIGPDQGRAQIREGHALEVRIPVPSSHRKRLPEALLLRYPAAVKPRA